MAALLQAGRTLSTPNPGKLRKMPVISSVAAERSLQQTCHFALAMDGSCRDLLDMSRLFRRATDVLVTLNWNRLRVTLDWNLLGNRPLRLRFSRRDLALLEIANRT